MLHYDRIVLALLLSKIFLKGFKNEPSIETEFSQLLNSNVALISSNAAQSGPLVDNLTTEQTDAMLRLSKTATFKNLKNQIMTNKDFVKWLDSDNPELNVPTLWTETVTSEINIIYFKNNIELEK